MKLADLRAELTEFYLVDSYRLAREFHDKIYPMMDEYDAAHPGAGVYELKTALYDTIADNLEPVVFPGLPFYYETGALCAFSDGQHGRGGPSANGWLMDRNNHIFRDADPVAWELHCRNKRDKLYLTCGPYIDLEHTQLNYTRIFKSGLSGIRADAVSALAECERRRTAFVRRRIAGLDAVQRMAMASPQPQKKRLDTEDH